MTTTPHQTSLDLAERLGVTAAVCEVVGNEQLSPTLRELTLKGSSVALAGVAGNDVMIRLEDANGKLVRRRYSVRSVSPENDTFSLWVSTGHSGPGQQWSETAQVGDVVDVVGPRGKITLDEMADWHLFIGDTSALGSFYRLAQSIEAPGRAVFIVEVEHPDDALTATFDEGIGITGIFVDRDGRALNDPAGLLSGLAAFAFPPDEGHAYLFGEFSIMRTIKRALLDRGLPEEAISLKAFWRMGQANEERGEPNKSEG